LLNVLRSLISSRSALVAENLFLRKQLALLKERKDYVIPVNENHLKRILGEFIIHYSQARPHSALGPGIPEPPPEQIPKTTRRHRLPAGSRVKAKPVLGGLHHEYALEKEVD